MANDETLPVRGDKDDILKHGAVVRFADDLSYRTIKAPFIYIDTHAFGVHTGTRSRIDWMRDVDSILSEHPYYTEYVKLQKKFLDDESRYRCPVGLVHDAIEGTPNRFYLAESREKNRHILRSQMDASFMRCDALAEAPEQLLDIHPPGGEDADFDRDETVVLTYIDLEDSETDSLEDELKVPAHFTVEGSRGIVQISADIDPADLPDPPDPYVGPIAAMETDNQTLFALSTEENLDDTKSICRKLGWELE
jgi:hypothetical protein